MISMVIILLIIGVIVCVIVLVYVASTAEQSRQEFENDIKSLLEIQNDTLYDKRIKEIRIKYGSFFRDVIESVRLATNTTMLTNAEINATIDYIIHESIKNERYKQFLADGNYTIITSENRTYGTIHDNTTR